VSGAATLKHTWFRVHYSVTPRPSLFKAALIATADSLREPPWSTACDAMCSCPCRNGDCRPSRHYGWGLVNVGRMTGPNVEVFFVNETTALGTGDSVAWPREVDDGAKDVLIVLAWTNDKDPDGFGALMNDLRVTVKSPAASPQGWDRIWYGNNFNENPVFGAVDDGYSHENGNLLSYVGDGINTVEAVFIPASSVTAGMALDITVTGNNVTGLDQSFAIYAYNVKLNAAGPKGP